MKLSDLSDPVQVVATPHSVGGFSIDQRGGKKQDTFDQSQAALGHSQGMLDTIMGAATGAATVAGGALGGLNMGAAKSLGSTLETAGAQNAGPVGADMLGHAPAFAQNIQAGQQALQPQGMAENVGHIAGEGAQFLGAGGLDLIKGAAKAIPATIDAVKAEGVGGLLSKGLSGAKSTIQDYAAKRAASKAADALSSTAETMTKGERKLAIAEGRMQPTITGGGKYTPSETEKRAGEILSGKLSANPVKNVPVLQDEIATRGAEAENFLAQNAKKITNQEHADMFATKRAEMAKYSTDAEMKAYDEQVGIFSKQLPGRGSYDTSTYYKALKDYEENVTSRLAKGKEALLTETGSAKLQAAKDVRSAVRDMIGEKNPEFKSKMYDLASLYDSLDNVITKAEKVGSFAKRHPVITKGAVATGAGAAAAVGFGGVNEAKQITGL